MVAIDTFRVLAYTGRKKNNLFKLFHFSEKYSSRLIREG